MHTSLNSTRRSGSTSSESEMSSEAIVLRPFYFIVVFWGEAFCNYLCDFCLPSLLSPNNIPVLGGVKESKFLFCTTPQDWKRLTKIPIFETLKNFIEPYYIEIPYPPENKSGCEHMGIGHKLAAQMAFRDKAFGVFLTPDLMVSDGTVQVLKKSAEDGFKVVLTAALRFGEEPLFENLRSLGVLSPESRHSQTGLPLSLSGRILVKAGLQSFHSQTQRYEWEAPCFSSFPCASWWVVPGEEGIILHSLSWAPLLCDYSAVETHDTSTFDTWTLDGDYVFQNFQDSKDMYIVSDSDEVMLVSWAPLADRPQNIAPNLIKQLPVVGEWLKGGILRAALLSGIFDALKQRIFFLPVRWHAENLSSTWEKREADSQKVLRRYLWDIGMDSIVKGGTTENVAEESIWGRGKTMLHRMLCIPIVTIGRIWMISSTLIHSRDRLKSRMQEALGGDGDARKRILQRFCTVWKTLRGVPMRHF